MQWNNAAVLNQAMFLLQNGKPVTARPRFYQHALQTCNKDHLNKLNAQCCQTTVFAWLFISDTYYPIILKNVSTPVPVEMYNGHKIKCKSMDFLCDSKPKLDPKSALFYSCTAYIHPVCSLYTYIMDTICFSLLINFILNEFWH